MDCVGDEPRGVRLPSAWNYGSIERALRDASERPGQKIFLPQIGAVFESEGEGYDFYNMYSWECGFGIRYGRYRENKQGRRSKQDIVCACEGIDPGHSTRSIRTGCRAMIRLLRSEGESWYISKIVEDHNHPMSESVAERRQWNSHNRIDPMTRDLVRQLRNNNVQISRVCSIVGTLRGGGEYVPIRRQSIRSLCGRLAHESIQGDMEKTISLFTDMKKSDPGFCLHVDVDDEKRLRSLFWCHGGGRERYRSFGDVVTFDTTYRTNLYNLPFGLFVGVNNHFQSIIFGAVLLTTENISAFEWAFRMFVDTMGHAPKTILTDQCQAMRAAISSQMPETRHRWCKWHVLRKAKESLGPLYSKNNGFKRSLHELLDEVVSTVEFEDRWSEMIDQYDLQSNAFLRRAFFNRAMWAKPYFTETFCAGMTSTQRSESANHMLKTYISRSAPMHVFVKQYNRMITDREADEAKEEHATKQISRQLRIGVPIEKDAALVYTRAMYERFSRELYKSGAFTCVDSGDDGIYKVLLLSGRADNGKADYRVGVSPDAKSYFCECKMYEHCGMPCRHILRLLVQTGVDKIPEGLVLKRWTKDAGDCYPSHSVNAPLEGYLCTETMRALLHSAATDLVNVCCVSRQTFELGIDFISRAKTAVSEMTVLPVQDNIPEEVVSPANIQNGSDDADFDAVMSEAVAPQRVRSRGRPKEIRLKSPIEATHNKRKRCGAGDGDLDNGGPVTRSSKQNKPEKCRICGSPDHYASKCPSNTVADKTVQARKCHRCGEEGHYRSTCGRKSTYSSAK